MKQINKELLNQPISFTIDPETKKDINRALEALCCLHRAFTLKHPRYPDGQPCHPYDGRLGSFYKNFTKCTLPCKKKKMGICPYQKETDPQA